MRYRAEGGRMHRSSSAPGCALGRLGGVGDPGYLLGAFIADRSASAST
jgi:hypothetical protein